MIAALALFAAHVATAPQWTAEGFLGAAANLGVGLRVRQAGEADVETRARYQSRSLTFPLYYTARAGRWESGRGWLVELVHHKLHLRNPPPQVQEFAISHGYNLLLLEHARAGRWGYAGLGGGVVVAHPENVVRGERVPEGGGILDTGYHASGICGAVLAGRPLACVGRWQAALEVKLTGAWANVAVARGDADVPNLAAHVTLGVGCRSPAR